jgi:hypothetical protein
MNQVIPRLLKKHDFIFGLTKDTIKLCFLFSDEEIIDCKVISFVVKPIKIAHKKFQFKLIDVSIDDLKHLYYWVISNNKKDIWVESDVSTDINGQIERKWPNGEESSECWFFHDAELKSETVDHYGYNNPVEVGHTYIMEYDELESLK